MSCRPSRILFAIGLALAPATVRAADNVVVGGALFYLNQADQGVWNGAPKGTTTDVSSDVNIGVGYKFDGGLYLGAKYVSSTSTAKYTPESTNIADPTSTIPVTTTSMTTTWTFSSIGVGVGFLSDKGLYAMASYLINPTGETDTSTVTSSGTSFSKYNVSGGSGVLVDLGYRYVANRLGIGPQISYVTASFSKYQSVDATGPKSGTLAGERQTKILPYLVMWVDI